MEAREVRGYAILAQGVEPKEIAKNTYKIPSTKGEGSYIVERTKASDYSGYAARWTCTCPDHQYRKTKCKHICAVEFWINLKGQVNVEIIKTIVPKAEEKLACPYCASREIVKNGARKTQTQVKTRYLCKSCKKTFIDDKAFEKIKATPEILTATLDLYFKGSVQSAVDNVNPCECPLSVDFYKCYIIMGFLVCILLFKGHRP